METLEKKRFYDDVISGIGSRSIIYMQNYIENYNYISNESMIPTSTPHDTRISIQLQQDAIPNQIIQQTEFPPDDIRLVATQAGVDVTRALDALRTTNGDIVNSILHLIQDI
jgi:hypothetical protein